VAPGDTLAEIAERYFGDESLWPVIHRANPTIIDPDVIHSGQQLVIPTISRPMAAPVP